MSTRRSRVLGWFESGLFGLLVGAIDLLPPKLRYAYVHPVMRRVLARRVETLHVEAAGSGGSRAEAITQDRADLVCALVADRLDVGGIGSVVEMLVEHLPAYGVRPVVICLADGRRAERMRARGIRVISVPEGSERTDALKESGANIVQLHSAPPVLEDAARASGLPLVPVLHNTEIHYSGAQWARFRALLADSVAAIAVSETVAAFHANHVPVDLRSRLVVVPNGAPTVPPTDQAGRRAARRRLGQALGADLDDDVVFVCLARYDAQKNIAGMVASFAHALQSTDLPLRLVVAGEPSDWTEYWRADGLRRRSANAERIHLLGNSDAGLIFAAADAFMLDSFFEGWPMAATEALGAGLPLVLSDVGGARELVARDVRSRIVANASGIADEVSDRAVARARRRSARQDNLQEFVTAVHVVAAGVRGSVGRAPGDAPHDGGVLAMASAHAGILRDVVSRSHQLQ